MAKFYGTAKGDGTASSRCSRKQMTTTCQSWDGSVIVNMWYDNDDKLVISLSVGDGSTGIGDKDLFQGSLEELKSVFEKENK